MPALKPKYEAFCQAYLVDPNAAAAARQAGYAEACANRQGYKLLRRPAIAQRQAALRAELAARECMNPDALLAKLETAYRKALDKDQPVAAARICLREAEASLRRRQVVDSQAKLAQRIPARIDEKSAADQTAAELAQIRAALAQMAPSRASNSVVVTAAPGAAGSGATSVNIGAGVPSRPRGSKRAIPRVVATQ